MNIKKNKTVAAGLIFFAVVFLITFHNVHTVLGFKYGDGIIGMEKLYEAKDNSIDVLALGSSHAFEDINTGVLFDSYGIAAYVLSGSVQPYWNTYYYLVEALKTQKPELIVLEAYASTFDFEYSDHSRIIKNTLGIKSPDILYHSLKISSPEDTFDDYWFHYRLWHSRYSELGESDFKAYYQTPLYQYYMGFGINFATKTFEMPKAANVSDTLELAPKTEEYYRKIIELSIEQNIPLLIVVSPFILTETEQMRFWQSGQIAREYGVDFINFNSEEYYQRMNLQFDTDFADRDHLNHRGNVKYTNLLAEFILDKYDLPDRRGDASYEAWELHSRDILGRTNDHYLIEETDLSGYLGKLYDNLENYTIIIMAANNNRNLEKYAQQFSLLKINSDAWQNEHLYVMKDGEIKYQSDELCWEYQEDLDGNRLRVSKSAEFNDTAFHITHSIRWNDYECIKDINGIYFVVYNNFSQVLVEVCRFCENAETGVYVKESL